MGKSLGTIYSGCCLCVVIISILIQHSTVFLSSLLLGCRSTYGILRQLYLPCLPVGVALYSCSWLLCCRNFVWDLIG